MSDAIMISVSSRAPGSGLLNTYRPTTSTKVQTIRQKRIVAANPHTTFSMRWRGAADCPPAAGSPSPLLLKLANLGAQSLESRRPVDSLAASGRDPVAFEHTYRSEEHTPELPSLMRLPSAVLC